MKVTDVVARVPLRKADGAPPMVDAASNRHSIEPHVIHQPHFEHAPRGLLGLVDGRIRPPELPRPGVDLQQILDEPPRQEIN